LGFAIRRFSSSFVVFLSGLEYTGDVENCIFFRILGVFYEIEITAHPDHISLTGSSRSRSIGRPAYAGPGSADQRGFFEFGGTNRPSVHVYAEPLRKLPVGSKNIGGYYDFV
jgi:hypothetical protein